ncbi:MAG TPA: TerC family protein [Vicinamibacterales bacterium]|nr:TerC family protein [Acidobacteriota bacterium]HOC18373.1 TerC family protein [Vicinamibacterales bacterium]
MDLLFPFAQYWWFYAAFTAGVLVLLAIDLGVFHRHAHVVSFKESLTWSAVWVALALAFNYGLFLYAQSRFPGEVATRVALEFLTGYLVEKSLAVDNVFVFVLVFSYFAVPLKYQHRVLFYGIIGALVFRAGFIALGSVLMQHKAVVIFFGVVLIVSGIKMMGGPRKSIEPGKNPLVRLFRRLVRVTEEAHGPSFFVRLAGRWHATPLLVALLFLEASDIVFAVDSVPAIFAITREPMLVFTSNVFAILGLRAMYFLLAGAIERFHLLNYGLALILVFVGLKMVWLNEAFGGKFPIEWSLGIIAALLAGAIVASLARPRPAEEAPGLEAQDS